MFFLVRFVSVFSEVMVVDMLFCWFCGGRRRVCFVKVGGIKNVMFSVVMLIISDLVVMVGIF